MLVRFDILITTRTHDIAAYSSENMTREWTQFASSIKTEEYNNNNNTTRNNKHNIRTVKTDTAYSKSTERELRENWRQAARLPTTTGTWLHEACDHHNCKAVLNTTWTLYRYVQSIAACVVIGDLLETCRNAFHLDWDIIINEYLSSDHVIAVLVRRFRLQHLYVCMLSSFFIQTKGTLIARSLKYKRWMSVVLKHCVQVSKMLQKFHCWTFDRTDSIATMCIRPSWYAHTSS